MRLKDKAALITGGGGDIARGVTQKFLANGASVILFDCDKLLLKEAVREMAADDLQLRIVVGDVRRLEDLEHAAGICERECGKVDILVTCAGVATHQPIDELPLEG
jgi:NAD(P)-dependent dehydrogenase (short-subunit alcohol dehydrogenase family)